MKPTPDRATELAKELRDAVGRLRFYDYDWLIIKSAIELERLAQVEAAAGELAVIVEVVESMGRGLNEREEFYCPMCAKHHVDCTKIPHDPDCDLMTALNLYRKSAQPTPGKAGA